jgi:Fe-S cluster biogenesis protein NfuA
MVSREKVIQLLNDIRPGIQMDGGDIEFVELKDNVVYLRMLGACGGCPMAQLTLKEGIERYLRQKLPEIISVEAV